MKAILCIAGLLAGMTLALYAEALTAASLNCSQTCVGMSCTNTCSDEGSQDAVTGSGTMREFEYDTKRFSKLRVGQSFAVDIRSATAQSVTVRADDNLGEFLDVRVEESTLVLDLKPGTYRKVTLEARVELPDLEAIRATGASSVRFEGFDSDRLELHADGVSSIRGFASTADSTRIQATGNVSIDLGDCRIREAQVTADGVTEIMLNMASTGGVLRGRVSGVSALDYCGELATRDISVAGVSSVNQRNDCHVD